MLLFFFKQYEIGLRIIGENSHFPSLHKISLKFFIDFNFIIKKSKNKACVRLNMIVYTLSLTFSLNLSYGVRPNKAACGLL